MAFTIDTSFKGIQIPAAYASVMMLSISLDKTKIQFGLWFYVSPDGEQFNAETYTADYDINGLNPFKQAYNYLKALPQFENAIDV